MKLKKDNATRVITDEETIKIFKQNGWEEIKEEKTDYFQKEPKENKGFKKGEK